VKGFKESSVATFATRASILAILVIAVVLGGTFMVDVLT